MANTKKEETVVTTVRMTKELHNLLYNEVKWAEKKSVGKMVIEALEMYLTKLGYK